MRVAHRTLHAPSLAHTGRSFHIKRWTLLDLIYPGRMTRA